MPDKWYEEPRALPRKCIITGLGSKADHRSFYESEFSWIDVGEPELGVKGTGQRHTLYISTDGMRKMCEAPGSPILVIPKEKYEALKAASEERDQLLEEKKALEEEAAKQAPVVVDREELVEMIKAAVATPKPAPKRRASKPKPKPKKDS